MYDVDIRILLASAPFVYQPDQAKASDGFGATGVGASKADRLEMAEDCLLLLPQRSLLVLMAAHGPQNSETWPVG